MRGRPGQVPDAFLAAASSALASISTASRAGGRTAERANGRTTASPVTAVASSPGTKADRQRAIRELVAGGEIASQGELVERLIERGFVVTQATVSRDIAELGLLKVPRGGHAAYVVPESLASTTGSSGTAAGAATPAAASDERLRRILADIPVTVGRSGLILLVTGSPGTASIIAQAIDESSLVEQEGTLAGDNTLLVLFADEARLLAWRARFDLIRSTSARPVAASAGPA
jgi:transcriptional regulator of arginine metabolism